MNKTPVIFKEIKKKLLGKLSSNFPKYSLFAEKKMNRETDKLPPGKFLMLFVIC